MFRRIFSISILFVYLAACVPATAMPLPTLTPVPGTATQTASPSPSPAVSSPTLEIATPTLEILPTLPQETEPATDLFPTETPFPTFPPPPTAAATGIPQPSAAAGAIQIYGPGPLSKVVSSVTVYGYAIPGYGNKGTVDLYGEDGRLLASELLQLNAVYKWAYFYWELPFEVKAVGELGRVSMSTMDQYGRVTALDSVHILLLAEGFSIINPPGNLKERCIIEQPVAGRRISGGVLTVAGKMRPYNSLPLVVGLVDRNGSGIDSQLVPISPSPDDSYVPFSVDLHYSISAGKWALLVVRQSDDRIGGTMYLYSQEVFLYP